MTITEGLLIANILLLWGFITYLNIRISDLTMKETRDIVKVLELMQDLGKLLLIGEEIKHPKENKKPLCPKCLKETNEQTLKIFGQCRDCLDDYSNRMED